jgi:Transposase/zinc-finger of transposase IS204/IS1001/IS1096/IS1165
MADALRTLLSSLFPPGCAVHLTKVTVEQAAVPLQLTATAPAACCPGCAVPSSSIHRRYQRHLPDLPWGARAVRMQLMVRKFVCRHATCMRRLFTARLPDFVATYARHPCRLVKALQAIGAALGGHVGARLAVRLQLPTRATPLLRLVRAAPIPPMPALHEGGVDEWAWRRGQRYGTRVVDLATPRVVDRLPDRSAVTIAAWLAQHPTRTVVCRDRSELDADGIRRGAPQAVPVGDRFHLVQNLRQALEALLIDHRPALQAAAVGTALALTPAVGPLAVRPMYRGRRRSPKPAQPQAERLPPPTPWGAISEALHTLHVQGLPGATLARQLGISRPPLSAYRRRGTPPAPRRPHRSRPVLRPSMPYLSRRWREGITDSRQLWRELQAHGYVPSAWTVCRFITRRRRAAAAGQAPEAQTSPYTRPQGPSARAVSCAWVCPAENRSPDAQTSIHQLTEVDPLIAQA